MLAIMYISIGLCAMAVIYLLLIMPSLRRHPVVERCMGRSYAHRGLHDSEKGIPENSLAAFAAAADRGFGMELDVHLTADRQLMVLHDCSAERMTGEKLMINEQTAERMSQCRLEGTTHTIPYLSEVLELIAGQVPLIIELKVDKGNHAALCEEVCRLLDGYKGDFLLESFDPKALIWLRRNRPELPRGQLSYFYNRHGDRIPRIVDFALHNFLTNVAARPDFLAMYHPDKMGFSLRLCRLLFRVPEFDWTVRTPEQQEECERLGNSVIFEKYIPEK